MISASRIVGLMLLAFAGTACGQITINPKLLVPLHKKNPALLKMPAPMHRIAPAPSPAPAAAASPAPPVTAPPSSGGTLIGAPLPPPPTVLQASAASMKEEVAIEPAEAAVMSASIQDAQQVQQQAQSLGMSVKRRAVLANLGLVISVLRVPEGTSVAAALAQLRQAMPGVWFDANQRYRLEAGPAAYGPKLIRWPAAPQRCAQGARIGMIDTPIDLAHPAFKSENVTLRSFLPAGVAPAAADHGTAIASLLVGRGFGLLPGAKLYAAGVFRSRGEHGADTDAELVVRALDWLAGQKVVALNLSFGGRRNQLLEAAILRVEELGVAVIAAAGNGGPQAKPAYPAAQPGVIAVTAVDSELEPYAQANRGDYIAFAAPGVDVWVAAPGGRGRHETGTSYAAPFATAAFAAAKSMRPAAGSRTLEHLLSSRAKDLGAHGKDPVFGWGLVQAMRCGRPSRGKH